MPKGEKERYLQKFREEWLKDPDLCTWLICKRKPDGAKYAQLDVYTTKVEDYLDPKPYLGYSFEKHVDDMKKTGLAADEEENLRKRCTKFILVLIEQIRQRLPDNIEILRKVSQLAVEKVLHVLKPSLVPLLEAMGIPSTRIDAIESQWRSITAVAWKDTSTTQKFWCEVYNYRDSYAARQHRVVFKRDARVLAQCPPTPPYVAAGAAAQVNSEGEAKAIGAAAARRSRRVTSGPELLPRPKTRELSASEVRAGEGDGGPPCLPGLGHRRLPARLRLRAGSLNLGVPGHALGASRRGRLLAASGQGTCVHVKLRLATTHCRRPVSVLSAGPQQASAA
ncbi:hypothetical protein HPB50_008362 [Hyalomma asiaticum]|uniref:Uncharacterized protein n=1 Tax=Hyalomma asiaticum TaxID=266040 RepID=A0ACB7TEH0_HYAAI|nr:hypothetical protein HPB50_008362 [Hyalomma asiaticum]